MIDRRRSLLTVPVLIFAAGLVISVCLFLWLRTAQQEKVARDFSRVAADRSTAVSQRIWEDFSILERLRQLYEANDWDNVDEFARCVAPILVKTPELDAIAWAPRAVAGDAGEVYRVLYAKSQRGRKLRIAEDLTATSRMGTAIKRSMQSGMAEWVHLPTRPEQSGSETGWLIVLPVYANAASGEKNTPAGVLIAQVDLYQLVDSVFRNLTLRGIDAVIYDGPIDQNDVLVMWFSLTRSAPYDPVRERSSGRYAYTQAIPVGEHEWTIYCRPAPWFLAGYRWWEPGAVLVGMLVLTGLVSSYELRQRRAALKLERQHEMVNLLENVAVAANEEGNNRELLDRTLQLICQYLGWPFGHVFVTDPKQPGQFISSGIFIIQDEERYAWMRNVTESSVLAPGEGLPGRVARERKPLFIPNLRETPEFRRKEAARSNALETCFAFPVLVRGEVAAVLEFYNATPGELFEGWQELLASMSTQISHAMERRLSADELLEKTAVLENAAEGIARLDRSGVYLTANKSYGNLCGCEAASLIGKNRLDLAHPDDEQAFTAAYLDMVMQGRAQVEGRLIRADGSLCYQESTIIRDLDRQGLLLGYYIFSRNITEREEQQKALRESEERFIAFMANNPACASIKDEQSRLLYVNPAFTEQFGIDFRSAIGRTPEELTHAEEARVIRESDETTLASNRPTNLVEVFPDRTGRMRHWLVYKFLIKGRDGKRLLGVLSLDITERMEAEEAIIVARDEALESARMKSQFLANMSHEIRTPMNGLIGMLGLLFRTPLSIAQKDLLHTATSAADSLLRLLNDILDFSKIEAGKMEIDPVVFDPRQCLRHAVKILAEPARKKALELSFEVNANVPPQLLGDSGRLFQIFVNLINNGIKFTREGSVRAALDVREVLEDGRLLLHGVVRDTGIGVEESHRELIFQPFRQSDNSTARQFGGTGLGLAICAQLVELMNGRIWVESEPAGGSAFHFAVEMGSTDEKVPALSALQPAMARAEHPLRILLAEDNEINQKIALTLLKGRGHYVVVANDGHEAVEKFQKSRFDLILMDVQMPGKDGYQATTEIRNDPRGKTIPIYAVTAHAMPEDRRRCLDVGMNDYLTKPIRIDEFARIVEAKVQRNERLVLPAPKKPVVKTRRIDWQPELISVVNSPQLPENLPDLKTFNLGALRQMVDYNDSLVLQLASSFIVQAGEDRAQITRALGENNASLLEHAAHRLKGSARSFSAHGLADITEQIEHAARSGDLPTAVASLGDFEDSLSSLLSELAILRGE